MKDEADVVTILAFGQLQVRRPPGFARQGYSLSSRHTPANFLYPRYQRGVPGEDKWDVSELGSALRVANPSHTNRIHAYLLPFGSTRHVTSCKVATTSTALG